MWMVFDIDAAMKYGLKLGDWNKTLHRPFSGCYLIRLDVPILYIPLSALASHWTSQINRYSVDPIAIYFVRCIRYSYLCKRRWAIKYDILDFESARDCQLVCLCVWHSYEVSWCFCIYLSFKPELNNTWKTHWLVYICVAAAIHTVTQTASISMLFQQRVYSWRTQTQTPNFRTINNKSHGVTCALARMRCPSRGAKCRPASTNVTEKLNHVPQS